MGQPRPGRRRPGAEAEAGSSTRAQQQARTPERRRRAWPPTRTRTPGPSSGIPPGRRRACGQEKERTGWVVGHYAIPDETAVTANSAPF